MSQGEMILAQAYSASGSNHESDNESYNSTDDSGIKHKSAYVGPDPPASERNESRN